jgi:hypothetical protein
VIEFELAKATDHTEKPAIMSDPTSTIIIAEAAAAAAGKFVEKAWESGEKWLATRYKDHYPRAVEKAKDNSRDFVNKLAVKVAQLEEQQQVDRTIIDRALEDPSFSVILQKALIGSSQTESQEKHELLAKLVTMKLDAPQESLRSVVAPLACEAVTHLTPNQLKILGIQTVLTLINPSFNESRVQTEADFLKRCEDWLTARLAPFADVPIRRIDLMHLESLSCAKLASLGVGEYPLAGYLKNWQCKDFTLTADALYKLPIGEKIKVWYETQALNRLQLTTTGQLLGFCIVELVGGTSVDISTWGEGSD